MPRPAQAGFAGKHLGDISAFDLERYKRDRVDVGVTVMVNRELACLKTLYNRCREWAPDGAALVFCHVDGSPYRSTRTTFQTALGALGSRT